MSESSTSLLGAKRSLVPDGRQFPLGTDAEGSLELAGKDALLLQMDVALPVAGATADAARVGVLHSRIEVNFVEDLSRAFGRDFGVARDDGGTVGLVGERVNRQERILSAAGAVVVDSAAPAVELAVGRDGVAWAALDAFAAMVAEMRLLDGVRSFPAPWSDHPP